MTGVLVNLYVLCCGMVAVQLTRLFAVYDELLVMCYH